MAKQILGEIGSQERRIKHLVIALFVGAAVIIVIGSAVFIGNVASSKWEPSTWVAKAPLAALPPENALLVLAITATVIIGIALSKPRRARTFDTAAKDPSLSMLAPRLARRRCS